MILDQLADYSRQRVNEALKTKPFQEIKKEAKNLPKGDFRFEKALRQEGLSIIAEVKKASPSKGVIDESFDYMTIARDYEVAGVDAMSCLTEPKWFLGSNQIFEEIRAAVDLPMLRKDFTVDPYQIYESKVMGADAVLIIVSLLDGDGEMLKEYLSIGEQLGISSLVETHDSQEIELAIACGARMIGVNNRNLKDFTVNFENAKNLRQEVPNDVLFVAESGVKSTEDVAAIVEMGADAALIGEALMRSENKKQTLAEYRRAGEQANEN